jgi:hypothetical protein
MGRSTGWADENGLLPTRGPRAPGRGAGRGPGVGPGRAVGPGVGPAAAGGVSGGCSRAGGGGAGGAGAGGGGGADGLGATGFCAAGAGVGRAAAALAAAAPLPAVFAGAGLPPPKDSRSRRATGASTVDDADLTNSPCSLSRARTSLLVTPSSLANSCTRALPATTSPVYEATAVVGRASGLAMTHGHRDFTVCSCSLLPVLLTGSSSAPRDSTCSTTADVSSAPAMRSARAKARRRIASRAHFGWGCSHAPRPGRLPARSTVTA